MILHALNRKLSPSKREPHMITRLDGLLNLVISVEFFTL